MVPLIIDTGASVTITPFKTDFISPIQPVQPTQIQGIASGLQVVGKGDVSYTFKNDLEHSQTITLTDCLYVSQCSVRLLCPHQIGLSTGHSSDSFNALFNNPILTVDGHPTTLQYDSLTKLPLLFTAPGITSYQSFLSRFTTASHLHAHTSAFVNMTKKQQLKLHLHEC